MQWSELHTLSDTELATLVREKREALRELRFKLASKQLTHVREVRTLRTLVAQALTLQHQRRRGTAKPTTPAASVTPS